MGEGGRLWAGQHGCQLCQPEELITDRAQQVYLDHKSRLDDAAPAIKRRRVSGRELHTLSNTLERAFSRSILVPQNIQPSTNFLN